VKSGLITVNRSRGASPTGRARPLIGPGRVNCFHFSGPAPGQVAHAAQVAQVGSRGDRAWAAGGPALGRRRLCDHPGQPDHGSSWTCLAGLGSLTADPAWAVGAAGPGAGPEKWKQLDLPGQPGQPILPGQPVQQDLEPDQRNGSSWTCLGSRGSRTWSRTREMEAGGPAWAAWGSTSGNFKLQQSVTEQMTCARGEFLLLKNPDFCREKSDKIGQNRTKSS